MKECISPESLLHFPCGDSVGGGGLFNRVVIIIGCILS